MKLGWLWEAATTSKTWWSLPRFSVFKTALFQWYGGISVNCQTSTLQLQPFMPVRNRFLRITIELKIAFVHVDLNP